MIAEDTHTHTHTYTYTQQRQHRQHRQLFRQEIKERICDSRGHLRTQQ